MAEVDGKPAQKPRVPAADVAKEFGVTVATVHNWKNLGLPSVPMGREFYFNLDDVREFLAANPTYGRPGRPSPILGDKTVAEVMAAVRIRKETALAERHEHNLARLKREVVPIEEVREGRLQRIAVVRSNLLALPGKLASRLAGRPEREIYQELDLAVRDLLAEFAKGGEEAQVTGVGTLQGDQVKLEDVA